MRVVQNSQIRLGELAIAEIRIDERSRDDIPAVLRGLQEIYTHDEKREQLFALLEESLTSKTRHTTGRPGMQLWRIFVLATLKQGLNCDFDRLQQYANHHDTVRQMLGHGDWDDDTKYPMQTLVDNIWHRSKCGNSSLHTRAGLSRGPQCSGSGVSNDARARQRPWISAVSARADSRAA